MKKLLTLFAAIAMATTLSMPAFAAKKHHHTTKQSQTKKHSKHAKHAKKHAKSKKKS